MMKHISEIMMFSVAGLTPADGLQLKPSSLWPWNRNSPTTTKNAVSTKPAGECKTCPECEHRWKVFNAEYYTPRNEAEEYYAQDRARMFSRHSPISKQLQELDWTSSKGMEHCYRAVPILKSLAVKPTVESFLPPRVYDPSDDELKKINRNLRKIAKHLGIKISSATTKKGWLWGRRVLDEAKLRNNINEIENAVVHIKDKKSLKELNQIGLKRGFSDNSKGKLFFDSPIRYEHNGNYKWYSWEENYRGQFHRVCKQCYDTAEKSRKWSMTKFRYTKGFCSAQKEVAKEFAMVALPILASVLSDLASVVTGILSDLASVVTGILSILASVVTYILLRALAVGIGAAFGFGFALLIGASLPEQVVFAVVAAAVFGFFIIMNDIIKALDDELTLDDEFRRRQRY